MDAADRRTVLYLGVSMFMFPSQTEGREGGFRETKGNFSRDLLLLRDVHFAVAEKHRF